MKTNQSQMIAAIQNFIASCDSDAETVAGVIAALAVLEASVRKKDLRLLTAEHFFNC